MRNLRRAIQMLSLSKFAIKHATAFQPNFNFSGYFRRRHQTHFLRASRNAHDFDSKEIRDAFNDDMTVSETLHASIKILQDNSAPEPTLSVCHLLSFALKDDFRWEDNGFAQLLKILEFESSNKLLSEKILATTELDHFIAMLERRMKKEPLQYIIGQWDFHDCVLKMRPPCLCPRPETEQLVEYAGNDVRLMIQSLRENGDKRKLRILDVGCGCGSIGLALANMFPTDVELFAIDVAEAAVDLSLENSKFVLGENQSFYHNPILCPAAKYSNREDENMDNVYDFRYDLIVSNPPYIPKTDMSQLSSDVIDFEDYGALCGGIDGLNVVKDILLRLPEWCERTAPCNFNPVCWMEVDTSHPILIEECVDSECSIDFVQSFQDFSGLDRFVKLEVKL